MKFAIALIVSVISFQASAGLFIEPMVAYEGGSSNLEYTLAGTALRGMSVDKRTTTAISYGGRLGYISDSGIWLAGDYSTTTSGKYKSDLQENTFVRTAIGADLGVWNGRWNLWVGYNFSDKLEITQQGSTQKDFVKGASAKVGIGYLLFQHVVFNIEYTYRMYTAGEVNSSDVVFADFPTYVKNFTQQSYSAGLSFPF